MVYKRLLTSLDRLYPIVSVDGDGKIDAAKVVFSLWVAARSEHNGTMGAMT